MSVLRAVLGRMQFTLYVTRRTPHGASRLVQAMPAWLVTTRHAPSRHSRDATVYSHTTTAMHKLSIPPPTPTPPRFPCRVLVPCPSRADLSRLLSAAVEAWCLPVHQTCRLPGTLLGGKGAGDSGTGSRSEGDFEGLCSQISLVRMAAPSLRLPRAELLYIGLEEKGEDGGRQGVW